jgi:drug/metabolite transporter (DMT)-like permease
MFATWPIVGKLALQTIPSLALVGLRVTGAALSLLILTRIRGRLQRIKRDDWPLLIVSSLLGLILNQWLFVKCLSLTTAINATLLSTTIPASTFLIGMFLHTERGSWRRLLGLLIAAAGVFYLIGPGKPEFFSRTRFGDLLIVSNSLCYGAYIAVSKSLVKRYDALSVITWIFMVGCIATAPVGAFSLFHVTLRTVPLRVWLEIVYIILLPTAASYFLNAWALASVPPSTVAVYIYLQPLIAFAVAPLILGEAVSRHAIFASLMVFAGVVLVTRRTGRSQSTAQSSEIERPANGI